MKELAESDEKETGTKKILRRMIINVSFSM